MQKPPIVAPIGLIIGAVLGMAGAFAPAAYRGVLWSVDAMGIIVASAMLTMFYFRKQNDTAAAGFLIMAIGESLVFAGSRNFEIGISAFGAGVFLWAAALTVVSLSGEYPKIVNGAGIIAAILFAAVSLEIFNGATLNPLTKPLPSNAYPFFAFTLLGWAYTLLKGRNVPVTSG